MGTGSDFACNSLPICDQSGVRNPCLSPIFPDCKHIHFPVKFVPLVAVPIFSLSASCTLASEAL